ncbi:MAG: hypothetical protein KGO47_07345 [Cyanobacteria bacterium REEB417]|nr:hypothetical protein [Cyanobacteria bacterium REEB417]
MTPLRLRPDGPQWPYSIAQLRVDEPQLSISAAPHAGEIASWLELEPPVVFIEPSPTDPPPYDPTTHRVQEAMPIQGDDDVWHQAWELIELPPPPEPEPQPDWAQFRQALISENGYAGAFAAIGSVNPMLTGPLPARLDRFEFEGQWQPFLDSLSIALAALPTDPVDPSFTAGHIAMELLALAGRCNLPMPFREALQVLLEEG